MARFPGTGQMEKSGINYQLMNARENRMRFSNDKTPVDQQSANEMLERIWPLYEAARLSAPSVVKSRSGEMGSKASGHLHAAAKYLADRELAIAKLLSPDFDPSAVAGVTPTTASVAKGKAEIRNAIDDFWQDGMWPAERRVIALLEAHLKETDFVVQGPVVAETATVSRSFKPRQRFDMVEEYFRGWCGAARLAPETTRNRKIPD